MNGTALPLADDEADAFDRQIRERVRHGHLPDLRRAVVCEYFYNNSWRRPEYVELDFGEIYGLLSGSLAEYGGGRPLQVLEVGCGPGHFALELARSGHDVTGIDLSGASIEVAEQVAADDPWRRSRGPLRYLVGDVMTTQSLRPGGYDAVYMVGTLHHFADQSAILGKIKELLTPGGLMLVHEPTRDRVTAGNATLVHLLRALLSAGGGYYQQVDPPGDADSVRRAAEEVLQELKYATASGEKKQSPRDNDAGWADMVPALRRCFIQLVYRERYAFFHELIGGLRFDDARNVNLARALRAYDAELCRLGVVQPTEFFFVGRRPTTPEQMP